MIVQLIHPGTQYPLHPHISTHTQRTFLPHSPRRGIRWWNRQNTATSKGNQHYRKYLEAEGQFITSLASKTKVGRFCFWGEWEPQSVFTLAGNPTGKALLPNAVHRPMLHIPDKETLTGLHNTDPYVFGEAFYYGLCKQRPWNALSQLNPGDIILFGTNYTAGFSPDTVMVIAAGTKAGDYLNKQAPFTVPEIYQKITLDKPEPAGPNLYHPHCGFTLYKARMHGSARSPFSFAPCLPHFRNKAVTHVEKPIIPFDALDSWLAASGKSWNRKRNSKQAVRAFGSVDKNTFFKELANCILQSGHALGTTVNSQLH